MNLKHQSVQSDNQQQMRATRLIVPQYPCNGGLDTKFQTEVREVSQFSRWSSELSQREFCDTMKNLNTALKPSRAGAVSIACLVTGVALLPLVPFALLTMRRKRLRKKILHREIKAFNQGHPRLHMRWRRKPASQLVIEMADGMTL